MIDAAIGGKTGVDVPAGKNLVGAFYPPAATVIDATLLQTLPDHELSNGLAEAIKHGAIADADYLDWIVAAAPALFERRTHSLDSLIRRSVDIKSACVAADPREAGRRAVLNFGHTIGHALERVSGYAVPHGHAVAVGMLVEAEIGTALGVTNPDTVQEIFRALQAARLPHDIIIDDPEPLLAAMRTDKKGRGGDVRYVLLERAGSAARTEEGDWTWPVPDDVVRQAFAEFSV
jgi:3-dehydroquinate synthase